MNAAVVWTRAQQPAAAAPAISDEDRMTLAGALGLLRGHRYHGSADALQRVLDANAAAPGEPEAEEHWWSACEAAGIQFDGSSYGRGFRDGKIVGADCAAPGGFIDPTSFEGLITAVRSLPTTRATEFDGEESDGTPQRWRNRPFVSRTKLERLLRERVAAPAGPAMDAVLQALRDYHYALDTRKHGGIAASNAIHAIEAALGMEWNQGTEAAARAPQGKEGAAP
ncbi:hypothetical protein A4F85_04840 [Delftia sp. GW456-R20]|nr:hypothetical protein A4F85_04840 [Delftia sp. GW456-R20]